MKVHYIEEADIEAEASHIIKLHEAKHGSILGYMIPVDEIAELTLGYHLDIMDLNKVFPEAEGPAMPMMSGRSSITMLSRN